MPAAIPCGIAKLFWYFQVPGTLSILGWLSALIILAACYRRVRNRHVSYAAALVLALLGFAFGHLNSSSISRIRTDVTDKLNEARTTQEEATQQQVAERRGLGMLDDVRFAEDDTTDLREREKETDAKKSIYELAAEGKTEQIEERKAELEAGKSEEYEQWTVRGRQEPAPEPGSDAARPAPPADDEAALERFDYRRSGKRERAADRKEKMETVRQTLAQEQFVGGRLMKESDVRRAQRLDRINLFFCRNTLWLVILMLLADYLFRANRTFWTVWPLPVAGRLLDYFYPKRHAVLMEPGSPVFLKGYLETAVRKGETFLYFGESDLWRAPAVLRMRIPPLPEACLRLWQMLLLLVENAGTTVARGYRALIGAKQRRASGAAGRASLGVRLGDGVLGAIDVGVQRIAPPVRRGAGFIGRRLHEGGLALRLAWITAQARYPLRLAPVAMLLSAGRGLAHAIIRRRSRQDGSRGTAEVFLLGRVEPERIGCRRWWDRGRLGVAAQWIGDAYRRYAGAHQRWQEWVERQRARIRRLDAVLFRNGIWFWVSRLHYELGSRPADRLFPFEAVWFNRYCCCIVGRETARAVVPDLLYFLKFRLVPRARAWHTVNIVWDVALPLEREVLDELVFRCRESNLRLMVVSHGGWTQTMADLFDEKAAEQIGPNDRARIEHMAALADRIAEQRGWAK